MATRSKSLALVVAAAVLLAMSAPAGAQSIMDGSTAFDNLNLSLGRPPGNMVTAGLGRAQDAADAGFSQVRAPQITETERPRSVREQALIDAFDSVINDINRAILVLINRWLARAGLMPLIPPEVLLPRGGGDGTGLDGLGDLGDLLDQAGDGGDTTDADSTDSGDSGAGAADSDTTEGDASDADATDGDTSDSSGGRTPSRGGRG